MRLQVLENGFRPLQKFVIKLIGLPAGGFVPGPIRLMTYRRDLFGKYWRACVQEAMRKGKEWTLGEVELFAAFVSNLNECRY
jgi:hypothetical protein